MTALIGPHNDDENVTDDTILPASQTGPTSDVRREPSLTRKRENVQGRESPEREMLNFDGVKYTCGEMLPMKVCWQKASLKESVWKGPSLLMKRSAQDRKSTRLTPVTSVSRMPSSA